METATSRACDKCGVSLPGQSTDKIGAQINADSTLIAHENNCTGGWK